MKKVLFVVALGAFAACNSGANSEAKKDSVATVDSSKMAADTSAKMAADTTKKDTTKPKM
jgi:hypothetical protein